VNGERASGDHVLSGVLAGAPTVDVATLQVRLHGRGGQGTVTAAELLSVAAFVDGLFAQAFPSFGSERMGAPVEAYCRISRSDIRSREPVDAPHALVIQDATLLGHVAVFAGLRPDGCVLINTVQPVGDLGIDELDAVRCGRVLTVPATELAREHLGRPTPNTVLLGAFAAMTSIVSLAGVLGAIRERFSDSVAAANVRAASAAFDFVRRELEAVGHAAPA
jgi:pyruvate ferredoxin oxidoreductase gamma subunit